LRYSSVAKNKTSEVFRDFRSLLWPRALGYTAYLPKFLRTTGK